MVAQLTVPGLSMDTHPVFVTSTRGKLMLRPSQDMVTMPVTTPQGHTLMVTTCTRAIQDMLAHTNTAAKPALEATTSTRGKLRLMPSQDMATDMATLAATTNQGLTLSVTMSTKAIQDTLDLPSQFTKPEATTSTRGRPRLSQDMATTPLVTGTAVDMLGPLLMLHQPPMAILPMDTAMDTGAATTIRNSG